MLKIEGAALQQFFNGHTLYIPKAPATESTKSFEYDGENNKYILMLFSHTANGTVPAAQRNFLEKILGATKLSFDDVAMVNLNNYPNASFEDLKDFFAPSSLFLWGVSPSIFNIQAQHYQPIIHNKVKVISVDAIEMIEKNDDMKKKLWGILKTHFLQ